MVYYSIQLRQRNSMFRVSSCDFLFLKNQLQIVNIFMKEWKLSCKDRVFKINLLDNT